MTFWKQLYHFFNSHDHFGEQEWIRKHQIFALMLTSFWLGIGIVAFGFYRIYEGNYLVGAVQLSFAFFLMIGFVLLRRDKHVYSRYSMIFFLFFFLYIHVVFFFVPDNHLNILWIVTAPVLIFFFLDKKAGIFIFVLLMGFIVYLIATHYPYSMAEYITLFAALATISLIMYAYEKVKEAEKQRLLAFTARLQHEIQEKTLHLEALNHQLEHRVEEEVQARITQEQMLLRQSRMASMGEMIDSIAHQWRQPLMNVNTVLMNLERGIETHKPQVSLQEKVDEIYTLTSHMSATIEDFRNLLKAEKSRKFFQLKAVIDQVLALLKGNLKGVVVDISCDSTLSIDSYPSEFSQVLIILLSNAAEALHQRQVTDKKIRINVIDQPSWIYITISDNAQGISPDHIEHIFDPYFTTKDQTGGTGLGLYIARIIIEHNMHGKLTASNDTEGAVFRIRLPKKPLRDYTR
jgi:signal transduction histidine kinase